MSIPANIREVAIQTHSIDYALKCEVIQASEQTVRISPVAGKVDMFQMNDPVVCLYMANGVLQHKSGEVCAVYHKERFAEFSMTDDSSKDERRLFERYPVSIAISARRKFASKRHHLVAKNISQFGMGAVSQVELDENEMIDIDLITGKYMFYFGGKVVWKKPKGRDFEYGLQLTHFDVATKTSFDNYLEKIYEVYNGLFQKAR